jgi:hypothetical protein
MDLSDDADPYPIILRAWGGSPRRAAIGSVAVLFGFSCVVILAGLPSDRYRASSVILGGLGIGASLMFAWVRLRRGVAGIELRIDRNGFVVEGTRVPWEAVISILWRAGPTRQFEGDFLEIRVRSIEGYRAPRDRTIYLEPRLYEVKANLLIDLLETAALPRRVRVLAVEPPPTAR